MTFKAKQFTGDAGAPVTIALNNQELESYSTTADFQTYTLEIPQATTTSTLSFSAAKGIRVYVDYVKVENVAARATPVTVAGYPKLVGNVLSYSVNGLESDSIYYYTVSPQNNSSIKTDPVLVKTLLANALPNLNGSTVSWSKSSNGVLLTGLPHNCKIVVSDISGKRITSILSENKNAILNLSTKGVYIIQILTSNNSVSLKVVY